MKTFNSTFTNISAITEPAGPADPAAIPLSKYLNHIIFIIEGTLMVIGNFLIIFTILGHKHLRRKELLLLAGLALGDGVYGIGIFYGGIKRLYIVLSHQTGFITSWQCALYFQTPCYWFGAQCSALMMIFTSIDRFIAVRFFSTYITLTQRYAWTIVSCVVGHCMVSMTVAYLSSYFLTDHTPKVSPICTSPTATPSWYSMYHTLLPSMGGTLSVVIYIGVVLAYRAKASQVVSESVQNVQLNRQKKLTKTLGIVTLVTFFCHMIPTSVISAFTVFGLKSDAFSLIGPYMWSVIMFNCLVNVFIYLTRMKNIRTAMYSMVCCGKTVDQSHVERYATGGPGGISRNSIPLAHGHSTAA